MTNPFVRKATGVSSEGEIDADEVRRAVALMVDPTASVQIQALPSGRFELVAGSDVVGILAAATELADGARGMYVTLNPSTVPAGSTQATKVGDIVRRRWILIDCDPVRDGNVNASQTEHDAANTVAGAIVDELFGRGWPAPIITDSGNGWHLYYRVDLPNDKDSQALVRDFLRALADRFDSDQVKVDRAVHNANRITKLPGTWARKGPHSQDRPHRLARIWHAPEPIALVTADMIREAIADMNPNATAAPASSPAPAPTRANPFIRKATSGGDDHDHQYAQGVLRGVIADLMSAQKGSRNNALNSAAFRVGRFLEHLDEATVVEALRSAGRTIGLESGEIEATIRSGLAAGRQSPASAPDEPGPSSSGSAPSSSPSSAATSSAATPRKPLTRADVATIHDLRRAGAEVVWLWPGWIPSGVLSVLAAEGGTGKTRFCCDLIRRIRYGLPWPDGQAMTLASDAVALLVLADNHHDEMSDLSEAFGIDDSIFVNAPPDNPYGGTDLDATEELNWLSDRIEAVKPSLVIVDTVGNSTDRNLSRQEDAKAYYQPLQAIARKSRTAIVCVTHLNAQGAVLGRRALEKVRVAIQMSRPDPEQENRRKLWVAKSNAKIPPALGVTMGDHSNDYDTKPPAPAGENGSRGRASASSVAKRVAADWLTDALARGPRPVVDVRREAEGEGISAGSLYAARDMLGVEEYVDASRKWWRLARTVEPVPAGSADETMF